MLFHTRIRYKKNETSELNIDTNTVLLIEAGSIVIGMNKLVDYIVSHKLTEAISEIRFGLSTQELIK